MLETMKKNVLIVALLVATVLSAPAGASEISSASLNRLLVLSGIQDLVSQFPGMLRMKMEQARRMDRFDHGQSTMSDDDYRALEETMVTAFKPAVILKAIGNAVKKSVSEQDAENMLAWCDTRLGKRLFKAEQDSNAPEAVQHMAASEKSLLAYKPRVIFAMKLDKLLHMTDMTTQFQVNARMAMVVAFSTRKHGHPPADLKALKQKIAKGMHKMRYRVRQSVIISTVYTYRDIDMKDLERYRAFLKSPAALRFNRALMSGMDSGMGQAINEMIRSVEAQA